MSGGSEAERLVAELVDVLDLERIEENLFRGQNSADASFRLFGGQVIAQALVAASRTVADDRQPHSLHAYFMRPGAVDVPVVYQVERDRDGSSFSTRRVVAIQNGKPIFNLAASFQIAEDGYEHQFDMPDVTPPEELKSETEWRQSWIGEIPEKLRPHFTRERPIDFRRVDQAAPGKEGREPRQIVWFRAQAALPDDPALHRCMLAYASDMTLLSTCQRPHGLKWYSGEVQVASLDHALWFHAPARADDWLLYVQDSPWAGGARGMNRGLIYDRRGRMIASVAQEGLMRPRK
ncbi:acyl-CoA thioesterase [Pacificimonas flava]|uniref:Acyl-CoA thioesterase 2 n=1 Tax=Pacificimonas flava TaxID=1234595 RepID=M2T5G5_9SPHN|nr:acyl-CoA thioesterase II [Pacificimonas flava]EMD81729.1 Acyl-CoA thioesterase II [Pacificimonas flava]MBB5279299.1 acyl-CoA thioesterase-2 [Pacificimonas flava]